MIFSVSRSAEQSRKLRRVDPLLVGALSLAFLFCLHGITWGRVECWNPDQIALRGLRALRPANYLKPPFHTYLNHVFVVWPATAVLKIARVPTERTKIANPAKLVGSRLLTTALYLGTVAFAYNIGYRFYGRFSAALIGFVLATSAGFIVYAHFLTADTPLLFWMLAAFWFAQQLTFAPNVWNYGMAGLVTGIATATKYNGLAVGIALVVAHFFTTRGESIRKIILSRQLGIGLVMVPVGFVLGCPTALYEPRRFWHDFIYNYTVTPRYGGQPDRTAYLAALGRIPEIVGIPGGVLIITLAISSCLLILRRRDLTDAATRGFVLSGAVFLLYISKVGVFPRTVTRFVLPAIPFLILMIGPALQTVERRKWSRTCGIALFLPVLIYNCICSYLVGERFNDDPRLAAQLWITKNVPQGSVIESSGTCPHWSKLPNFDAREINLGRPHRPPPAEGETTDLRLPHVSGRAELFRKIFPEWVQPYLVEKEKNPDEDLFTAAALLKRDPDYISVYSWNYQVPSEKVRKYYSDLIAGKFPYVIVFDAETARVPAWTYPRTIDFLAGRITIFQRKN
jgi:Dolichyl-phosphate-mannose-protein mannosyltransferase